MGIEGLIALKTAPPSVAVEDAERLALEVYGVRGSARALPGERDRNFRFTGSDGRAYVLKIVDQAAEASILDCQAAVLRHLGEQAPDLPVPRLVPALDGSGLGRGVVGGVNHRLRLVTWLPGVLAASRPASTRTLDAIGQSLARLDRALAGFFHVALAQRIVWDVRQAPALREFADYLGDEGSRRLVRRALDDFERPARRAAWAALAGHPR